MNMQHVIVGVVRDTLGRILLALRPPHVHQGGLWEFPGGKVEAGEEPLQALRRELHEEVGLDVVSAVPLIQVPYHYTDKSVLLDVWEVKSYSGDAHGREGQALAWVMPEDLSAYSFPAANLPIITAVRLPDRYLITPEPQDEVQFLNHLERLLQLGLRLVQLRAKRMPELAYTELARQALVLCRRYHAWLLLNASVELMEAVGADGVHLTGKRLMSLSQRPLGRKRWVAASCHNPEELGHACAIGVDFVVVGPVAPTASHPGMGVIGWEGLKTLCAHSVVPVYALGGMQPQDMPEARRCGAQGIAAISGLWNYSSLSLRERD